MIYFEIEENYYYYYDELKSLNLQAVQMYFDTIWHNIRIEWTLYGKNGFNNLMERTTNRVESFNQKIKLIVNRYSNLDVYFGDLLTCMGSTASEKDHKAIQQSMKRPRVIINDPILLQLKSKLTNFAYIKVKSK